MDPPIWVSQYSLSATIEDEGADAPMETRLQDLVGVALIGAGAVIYMRRRNGGGNSVRRSRRRAWRRAFGRHIHVPAGSTGGVESVDMMAMVPPTERDLVFRDYNLGMTEPSGYSQDMPTPSIKPSNQSNVTTDAKPSRRPAWMRAIVAACLLMMGGVCLWPRATQFWSASETTANAATSETAGPSAEAFPTKRIEDVRAGDWVLAREEHGERQNWKRVAESYRRTAYHLRHLTFQDANGHTQTLQTTDEHPFWSVTAARFVDAGNLHPGDLVTSPDGQPQTLTLTHREEHPEGIPVFNFQVAGFHTYYVLARGGGTKAVLVHNSNCPLDGDLASNTMRGAPTNLGPVGSKAPRQVTPGIGELEGHYIDDLGRSQPWRAHYDKYGRMIGRTDYNAGNRAAGIPDIHHEQWEYNAQFPLGRKVVNHIPGEFPQ